MPELCMVCPFGYVCLDGGVPLCPNTPNKRTMRDIHHAGHTYKLGLFPNILTAPFCQVSQGNDCAMAYVKPCIAKFTNAELKSST